MRIRLHSAPICVRRAGLARFTAFLAVATLLAAAPAVAQDGDAAPAVTALVIIDIQEFYFPSGALPLVEPEAASLNAGRLLARWRREGRPVVHVGHLAGSGVAFHGDVQPSAGEKVVMKDQVNAFKGTDLQPWLKQAGVGRLVICGMQTHMCVEAAARAAADLGYTCLVVGDACATRDLQFDGRVVAAADVHVSTLGTLAAAYARVVDTDTVLAEP